MTKSTLFVGSLGLVALLGCSSSGFKKGDGPDSDPGQAGAAAAGASGEGDGAGGATSLEPMATGGDAGAGPCSADAECDDGAPCNGAETCSNGTCVAGQAVACEMSMVCSDTLGGRCVFTDESPWIIYMADDDTPGVPEIYAIKTSMIGAMSPIKLNRELEPGWVVRGGGGWSPDRRVYALHVGNSASLQSAVQLVHFGGGVPDEAQHIEGGRIEWAPSGLAFAVTQATGLVIYEYSGDGRFEEVFRALEAGTENTFGAWTPADEYVYSRTSTATQKSGIKKVLRGLTNWGASNVFEDLDTMRSFYLSPDGTELTYELGSDGETRAPLYVARVAEGSVPKELAPAGEHAVRWSPDGERFLVEKQTYGGKSYFLGAGSIYDNAPVPLASSSAVDFAYFTPDSRQVILVVPVGLWGRDYYLLDPAVSTQDADDLFGRSGSRDGGPRFAPDHDLVAMPTRAAEGSNAELMLFSLSGRRSTTRLDWAFPSNTYHHISFSKEGQFLVFAKGVARSYEGSYVDLRDSTVHPVPVRFSGDGSVYRAEFGGSDTDLIYVLEQSDGARECFYLDLTGQFAKEPVKLSRAGRVDYCIVQPSP